MKGVKILELTKDEIIVANNFLRKRSLVCSGNGKPVGRVVIDLLNDNMSSEDFNEIILTKLCYENKHKLITMLSQRRYNRFNPSKQLKFKKKIADKFMVEKGEKDNNKFLEELLEFWIKNK